MTPPLSRTALFLAVSALLAPSALAQTTAAPAQTPPTTTSNPATPKGSLQAVEVRGEHIPEPQLENSEVASYVTKQDLERTGDSNAAEALTRVTGLSLVQRKFVYVRGLGERYSSALLNGSPLPSPEPLQRVVPLDLFPANVLESIAVQKTYSANFPGEFGGGVIDLQTISIPDVPFLTLSIGGGGNSETTFQPGLTYYGSDTDLLGYDDGTRDLPAPLREAMESGERIDSSNFSSAELNRIGRSFVNAPLNLMQTTDNISPDVDISASAGRSFDIGESGKLGLIAVAGFKNQWRTRVGVQQEGIVENDVISVRTDYDFLSTQNDATVNALVGVGYEWGNNKLKLNTMYVHDTSKEARSREGNDEAAGAEVRDDFTEWFERELVNTHLSGSHLFGEYKEVNIEWRASHARATREAPYEKGIRYRLVNGVYEHDASQEQNYTRFSTVNDQVTSAGIDATWNLPTERTVILSAGYAWLDNKRDAQAREFRFLALNGSLPSAVRRERIDFLLSDYNIDQGLLTLRETTGADGAAAYEGKLEVNAFYAQVETQLLPSMRITAGLRYEDATQSVQPIDLFGTTLLPSAAPLNNNYVLPAFTGTWNFSDNKQLRFGASKTIARPQFRELAPQQYLDPDSDRLYIGNPYLIDTELTNLDARYEWYFANGEFFTFGGFYKDIKNPVEAIVNEAASTIQQTYINAPRATLYGIEADYKKYFDLPFNLSWIGSENRLFVAANYTWSQSEVSVSEDDVVFPLAGGGQPRPAAELVRDGSQLQGQSEHLANFQIGVEDSASRSQAALLVTYAGPRISARGRPGQPDFIQKPGALLDFVARKAFSMGTTELTFGFEARNLLGTEYQEFQELGGGRVDLNRYDLGTTYSFNLSASF